MLLVLIILLALDILLNLAPGIFLLVALGELGTLKKYRFEFSPALLSAEKDEFGGRLRKKAI